MINKNIKNNITLTRKTTNGFTLVETMVAVLILSFTITALMYVVSDSLFTARYSRYQVTAVFLAQEASDFIRNDRDNYFFTETEDNWQEFVEKYVQCFRENGCYFEVLDLLKSGEPEINLCNNNSTGTSIKCPFFYDNQNGGEGQPLYAYNYLNKESKFQRKVAMREGNTPDQDEIILTVTVLWKEKNISKETVLETILTKWQ